MLLMLYLSERMNHPAEGVEPVASDSLFETDVIIRKKEALEEARKERTGLVLWTDGSKLDQGQAAAAVCWKDKTTGQWKEKSIFLGKNKKTLDAELWAVLEALDIVKRTANLVNTPITIFCDSEKALKAITLSLPSQITDFKRFCIPEGQKASK